KVIAACGGDVLGKRIGVLGLTFKPNTDDMRDAPSINIIQTLQDANAMICAYDPIGMEQAKRELGSGVTYAADAYDCANGADALVIITEWEQFRALDLNRIKSEMASPVLVDLRNIYEAARLRDMGFTYVSVGRT
ncbi:MAG: UDP binding domain-containing protein, partial [Pseudomonadota bacterium]